MIIIIINGYHYHQFRELSVYSLPESERQKFLRPAMCPVRNKKWNVYFSCRVCTPFRSWTTFWLPPLGAGKRWYLRSWTTRTFQIVFPRFMASFFLVPLAKRCVFHWNPTFPHVRQVQNPWKLDHFDPHPPPHTHTNVDHVLDLFGVAADVKGWVHIISSRSASSKHG